MPEPQSYAAHVRAVLAEHDDWSNEDVALLARQNETAELAVLADAEAWVSAQLDAEFVAQIRADPDGGPGVFR